MNITSEGDDMRQPRFNQYQIELEKATDLLKEAVLILNIVPNRTYIGLEGQTSSYKLASKIDKYLKKI